MRPAASVANTDRPTAPPTWTVVLTRPDARPASCGVAEDIASDIKDGKLIPAPTPKRSAGGRTSSRYDACTGVRAKSSRPAVISARLATTVARAPSRALIGAASFRDIAPITMLVGRKANPTPSASYPSTCWR